MAMRMEMVSVDKMVDAYSGICFADTTQTISRYLSKSEIDRYAKAMYKVGNEEAINRKDLIVLDKIDAVTYEHHGMCLKDSAVTKARLRACKKYKVQFIDRDGLVEHMNLMISEHDAEFEFKKSYNDLNEIFEEALGPDVQNKISKIISKLDNHEYFDLTELHFLSEMEAVACSELDWTIVNQEIKMAIERSCKNLGIYFQNLQQALVH